MAGKTAAGILQEMAVKAGITPEYECVAQTGPPHLSLFEYHCQAFGLKGTAVARSKKTAKQEAAQALLHELSSRGYHVPAPFCLPKAPTPKAAEYQPDPIAQEELQSANMWVALLNEYCEQYRLPAPEYTLIGDSGPPHHRSFTMRVAVGAHSREATAFSKKAARQLAAEAIYKYLRGCLRSTQEFVEKDALARNIYKRKNREREESREKEPWRPPLDLKVSEYHCGLALQFDEERRVLAFEALRTTAADNQPPSVQLACAASALGLEPQWGEMPSYSDEPRVSVELPDTCPPLVYTGRDREEAAASMVRYLNRLLVNPTRDPMLEFQEAAKTKGMCY